MQLVNYYSMYYMKQAINRNYGVEDVSSNYAAKVYSIGIGTSELTGDDLNLANITLNPKDHWNDNNGMANSIRNAWNGVESQFPWGQDEEGYTSNGGTGTPEIVVDEDRRGDYEYYELTHPDQHDIVDIGLQYNDAYYDAISAEDINTIFSDIVSSISINTPQVPTKIEGNDPVHDGYITYTDVIGDYMEVDSVKTLIWAGQQFTNPAVSGEGTADVTYTFSGPIDNPAYENAQNANQIQITVHTDTAADGTRTQTMTVKIPATAIPLRVNTIELNEDGSVYSNTSNNAYPLRLVYGVSLQDSIDPETLDGVSEAYIEANTDENGKVNFYSNKYSGNTQGTGDATKTVGDAKVEFTPADNNPFYFLQENTPIYMSQTGDQRVTQQQFSENGTYWVPVTYYEGNQIINTRVERSGSSMADYIQYEQGEDYPWNSYAYIQAGAPRLGNIEQFIQVKGTNTTGTAATSFYPTFEGTDVHDGKFVVYLGNNGKLQLDAPASLIIDKNVSADGLTAPDATFTFEITSNDKTSQTVSAVKTTGTGESASTEDVSVVFDDQGVAEVQLTADQTIELKGMAGADYSIREINIPDGFTLSDVTGADSESGNGNETVASGEIAAGAEDELVTFTNNYSVEPITSDELNINLGGTKNLIGRDFKPGDSFTFTIAAAQATPDAPLPTEDTDVDGSSATVTITPDNGSSADFSFGSIEFTKPGEYRYIIREVDPYNDGNDQTTGLGGIDYDAAIYRINMVIVDNGDGTLRLATPEEIAEMDDIQGNLVYTSNPMIQEYVNSEMVAAEDGVLFENNYSADNTTASIQGTKVLNVTDSNYSLQDGDFLFTIEALGSNTDGGDTFTPDETQPMPVDTQGQQLIQTANIANGNVVFRFASGAFTQDMRGKTFGYKITESAGDVMDNVTFDQNRERIVKITVGDDGQGHVVATVTPNDVQQGQQNNFTFNNSYEPTKITIGNDTNSGITVQKTFTGHEWTSDYEFEYTIAAQSNTAGIETANMPMPDSATLTIGNPTSGSVNTAAFGEMTFERAGTYTYTITEENAGHGGITYDGHTATVTVTVTENSETGTLSASVSYDNRTAINDDDKEVTGAAAFTNTYSATFNQDTAVNLDGTKNLTVGGGSNRTLGANQFFFVVTPLDGAPYGDNVINQGSSSYMVGNAADSEAENGTFSGAISGLLDNVTYQLSDMDGAASKDFVYLISEQQSGTQGMTYDGAVYRVTVTVTDDGNGTLSAGEPQIVKGSMQDGSFVADADQSGVNGIVFNNSYTPNASDPVATQTLKKVLSGDRDPGLRAGEFEFKIELSEGDASGVTLPDPNTVTNDADGNINFGNITFTKAGTYKIKVTEIIPDDAVDNGDGTYTLNHVTYDTHVVESTFTVTDRNGKLTAARTGTDGSTTFTNTYQPDEITTTDDTSVDTNILVTKEVTGAPAIESFTFSLNLAEGQDGSNVFEGSGNDKTAFDGVEVTTSENIAAGATETKAFAGVTFTAAGDYRFVIDETTTTTTTGWTYDEDTVEITVHVEDQSGQLVITSIDGNKPTFTNSYVPNSVTLSSDSGLKATKSVTGAPALSEFEFNLALTSENAGNVLVGSGEDATEFPEGGITMSTQGLFDEDTQTGSEDATETVSFGDLTFTAADDYTFTVDETTTTEEDGWTYDNSVKTITVHVTDDNYDGQLDVTVEGNNPTFYNTYYNPEDAKSVQDADGNDIDGQLVGVGDVLTYTIDWVNNAVDEDGVPVNADVVITDSVPAGTTLVADSISEGGDEQDGTITWTLEDQAPGASGQVSFKVTVTEDAAGSTVDNSAEIKIGDNNPAISTVTNPVPGKEETSKPDKIGEGTVLTYQISFTNTDGENASAEVVDTLTRGQGYNAGSATVQIGDGEAFSMEPAATGDVADGQTITWNLTGLPDNAEVVITFDVTVTRDAGASVDNTATVNGHKTNTTTTPYPSDSKKDVANADEPTISIDGKLAGVGDTLIYTIDWAAEADGTLTITDEIPDGTAYVDDSADNSGVYDEDTNTITWTFEDLEEGDKGTVTFKVTITDAAVNYDEISNTASLQIGDNDPTTTNEVTTDIPKKEVSDTTPAMGIQVGDTLTYTIEYRNDTEEPATVTVTDILPAGLSYASVPEGQSAPEVTTSDDGREVLTWTFENVEPSSEASTVTFNTVVNENATIVEDPVTNKATVTVGEHEYDTNTTGGGVEVQTGNLTISKEIVLTEGQGTEIDTDKEFTFTVTLTGTNGQPLTGTYQYQIGDGEAQELDFNDNGQATLNLKHNESATITGLPDGADYTVTEADYTADGYTTTTPDNDSGKITADGVTVDFTNTYRPSGIIIGGDDTEAGITVQKTFTGRDWAADDSFEFTIQNTEKPESAATAPMPGQTTVTIGADGAADGMNSAAFGAMSFDTIGKYVYEITETHAGETIEGISYDAHTATVTVNVTDAGNGKLQAEVTYDNFGAETEADQTVENAAAFTNTYKPGDITIGGEDTQAGITVQKTLAGRAWETKDGFEFSLKAVTEDAPMPDVQTMRLTGTAGEETPARAAFGEMTFTKDKMDGQMTKDFVYTVTETSTGGNGVTVDPSTERTVTVTVTDDGKGNLSAEVKYNNAEKATTDADKAVTDAAAFTNTYDAQAAESVPANFTLTKVFEGHDWTENYTFQFRLTPVDGAPMPAADENAGVTIADDGSAVKTVSGPQEDGTATFDFGAITYEAAGDYTYTVTEISGDNPGVTYSGNTATVTVHVTDKGDDGASTGQLVASATVENGTFTNTYKTGEVAYDTAAGLQIVKNMTGRAIGTDEFTFTMTGVDEESIARLNNGTALEFKTEGAELTGNTASETIRALTGLTFTQTDVGNTYTYTVKETIPDGAADNGNGTYTLNGMTYDGTSYEVQFVVTEDGEGTLLVETFVDGVSQGITQGAVATNALPAQLVFNNSYDAGTTTVGASGEAQIQAVKVLNNDDIANYAEQFHFSVIGSNNVKVASGTNDAAGNITFSDIVYNTENLNAAVTAEGSNEVGKATVDRTGDQDVYTFNYTVSEDTLDPESGVSYNGGTFGVTVTVTDDRAGNLTVAVAYDNGGDKLTFENTYGADSEFDLTLTGNKVIAAAEGLNPPTLTGGEYQFTIVGSEGAPMPETTTVSNQGATVSFGPITYTMENVFGSEEEAVTEDTTEDVAADTAEDVTADAADDTASDVVTDETEADGGAAVQTAGRTKVFTYTISESGELAGVTNEEGTKTVEVTVTDMGGGELTAAVTNVTEGTQDGSDFTFTNTYSVTPEESTPTGDGEGSVTITKMLDGRSLNEGEFTFRMTDAEGNVVSEGTNDAAGNVELGGIIFEKPGTYSYTIREVDNGLGGVTYDTSVYTATAIVTDDQDGTLSVAWEVKAAGGEALDAVTFANSYKAAPTSVSLGAAKRLDGRALKDGEFTFELKDQDGNVVSSAKNDENGAVAFDTISFDKAGTYNYTVTEAAGSDETITYDNTVYKVTITVTDDGNGSLSASVDTGDKNLVFTNKYTKPAEPQKPDDNTPPADGTPKAVQTGDTTPIIPAVIAVLVSLAAIAAVVVLIMRRRRR